MKKSLYNFSRYFVAVLIITYAFAKLNGSQFTVLDSELDKPLGQVSGFWLTWYYFGYSPFYGNFIALGQILGGIFLTFRRTTLLGSLLLFPIMANIVLIDIFYGVDFGALLVALLISGALLFILAQHRHELFNFFWVQQNRLFPSSPRANLFLLGKGLLVFLMVLVPATFTYWVANFNNRLPTPIDGTWETVQYEPTNQTLEIPSVIFFEYNRAYMVVFKYGPERYETHHFEVAPASNSITIWESWLSKGEKIFEGEYELSPTQLILQGRFANQEQEFTLYLTKRPE